ncbi:hypothetical protein Tco_0977268 [Tanacetum coccineum]|uniref:Uncharacterized protein n=1 Tax=Tanacetum coccineum TaxID=301880 RepID=A0ABQ5EJL4_9ASTR
MKNLDDAFTYGDQFLYDKPTEEEPGKANVETKVESMVTAPIHQASSTDPPLFTLVIDLTPPKPVSPPIQEPIFTAITATTTTTHLPPPPPQQQSNIVLELATRVFALEKICANFEKKHKLQEKTNQALSSRVFTLENHDLYSKIDNYVNETPEHAALYDALEASMDRENREEFIETTAKSRKRRRDDQDPPPPPLKDSDQSKNKRHDSDPVDDVLIPDDVHISDSEDTSATHLPKIKTRPDWLKPVLEEERPETPEPDWVNTPSSSKTLSSMKNLDDAFTYGDQFLYDKPTEEEPGKANVETKVESMVTDPIHQASSTDPPLFTLVIDLTPPKPVSPPIQEPIFTAITATTTTTHLPPPPP